MPRAVRPIKRSSKKTIVRPRIRKAGVLSGAPKKSVTRKTSIKCITAARATRTPSIARRVHLRRTVQRRTTSRALKPIGRVTHFYNAIGVAVVRFAKPVKIGELLRFNGATTDFSQIVVSMQYSHKSIQSAARGREVGIKVDQRVREGDEVFLV